jgi:hypothetical protein
LFDGFILAPRALFLTVALSLSVLSVVHSNTSFAENSSDISEIQKLYSEINREVKDSRFKKLYIFTIFPSDQRLIQETYTDDVKYSPDVTIVRYRKGYVAKIEHKATDGDIVAVDEYYFRQNGLLFFQYSEHDELTGLQKETPVQYESRFYVNAKGRLIRMMRAAYYLKNGKKNGLVYSDNKMDINLDPKDNKSILSNISIISNINILSNIKDFEFFRDIEKYVNKED